MNKLNDHADVLEKELSGLVFIEGQSMNVKGIVSGDALTASDDPARSTFAQGSLEVHQTLSSLEDEVSANLSKSGFIREGSPKSPYFAVNLNGGAYDSVMFRYTNEDRAIRVMYTFDRSYECLREDICEYTPENSRADITYPANEFNARTVIRMTVNLADKSNGYHASYLY